MCPKMEKNSWFFFRTAYIILKLASGPEFWNRETEEKRKHGNFQFWKRRNWGHPDQRTSLCGECGDTAVQVSWTVRDTAEIRVRSFRDGKSGQHGTRRPGVLPEKLHGIQRDAEAGEPDLACENDLRDHEGIPDLRYLRRAGRSDFGSPRGITDADLARLKRHGFHPHSFMHGRSNCCYSQTFHILHYLLDRRKDWITDFWIIRCLCAWDTIFVIRCVFEILQLDTN